MVMLQWSFLVVSVGCDIFSRTPLIPSSVSFWIISGSCDWKTQWKLLIASSNVADRACHFEWAMIGYMLTALCQRETWKGIPDDLTGTSKKSRISYSCAASISLHLRIPSNFIEGLRSSARKRNATSYNHCGRPFIFTYIKRPKNPESTKKRGSEQSSEKNDA